MKTLGLDQEQFEKDESTSGFHRGARSKRHPRVVRVVALSGGDSREDADDRSR
ncbi:MAG TPA: hypothetical protein VHP99_03090 [Pyrinomonadaceae bacterium]|nr:hypothetical protein [Pyrinomonadaceae bacterium]